MKSIRLKDQGKTYIVVPVDDNPQQSAGDSTSPYMYYIKDETDEVIGCLTFTWSRTLRATVSNLTFRSPPEEELAYLAILPYIPLPIEKITSLYKQGSYCFRYLLNTGSDGLDADNKGYHIKMQDGMRRSVQKLMFGGTPTDDQVRRQILKTLHDHWLDDPHTFIPLEILKIFVPVDDTSVVRNVLFLLDEDLIEANMTPNADPPKVNTVKIKNKGIKYIEDQSEFSIKVPSEFVYQKIVGNQINATTSGNNSPIIMDSHNIDIVFNDIKTEVEKTEIENKQETLVLLQQLNEQLKEKKDPSEVKNLLDKLKGSTKWVYEKVINNPIISGIIVELLMKAAQR